MKIKVTVNIQFRHKSTFRIGKPNGSFFTNHHTMHTQAKLAKGEKLTQDKQHPKTNKQTHATHTKKKPPANKHNPNLNPNT